MIGRICYGLAILCIIALACLPVLAHVAESGWEYDLDCCSGLDCALVEDASVTPTAEGWLIEIQPGQHPSVTTEPWSKFVPYTSDRIRPSGDHHFHVCVGAKTKVMFCLYVPEGQWGA